MKEIFTNKWPNVTGLSNANMVDLPEYIVPKTATYLLRFYCQYSASHGNSTSLHFYGQALIYRGSISGGLLNNNGTIAPVKQTSSSYVGGAYSFQRECYLEQGTKIIIKTAIGGPITASSGEVAGISLSLEEV